MYQKKDTPSIIRDIGGSIQPRENFKQALKMEIQEQITSSQTKYTSYVFITGTCITIGSIIAGIYVFMFSSNPYYATTQPEPNTTIAFVEPDISESVSQALSSLHYKEEENLPVARIQALAQKKPETSVSYTTPDIPTNEVYEDTTLLDLFGDTSSQGVPFQRDSAVSSLGGVSSSDSFEADMNHISNRTIILSDFEIFCDELGGNIKTSSGTQVDMCYTEQSFCLEVDYRNNICDFEEIE